MYIRVTGGTYGFNHFLSALCNSGDHVLHYASPDEFPFCSGSENAYVILPRYEGGEQTIPEQSFEWLSSMSHVVASGARVYVENYVSQDYLHGEFTLIQVLGQPRHLHQEYIEWADTLLQARDGFYLPNDGDRGYCTTLGSTTVAKVSNCMGTHRVVRPGTYQHVALRRNQRGNVLSAAMNLSAYSAEFRRPYATWKRFFCKAFAPLFEKTEGAVGRAFSEAFPDPVRLSGQSDPQVAVRRALKWHRESGLMRAPDGSQGIFEMVRSNDFSLRANLRTDSEMLTAALFTSAGERFGECELTDIGIKLADFLLDRHAQQENGLFRWYDHTLTVWSSDSSRVGLALWQLYKTTGIERYRQAALDLGEAFLRWLEPDGLCCGYIYQGHTAEGRKSTDNPVFYGEMVAFLMQLGQDRYVRAASAIIQLIRRRFSDIKPFGYSLNFTFSRWLLMLASAQCHGNEDYSESISQALDFFRGIRNPKTGAFTEAPINLTQDIEAGVAIGDGSDAIADLLYCNNFVLCALSILVRLPDERRGMLDPKELEEMYVTLRDFWVRIQITSPNPKLDGGWMRAFDLELEEYFGLNKDMDWGSYCIMAGWVTGFVPLVLLYDGMEQSPFITAARS